MVVPDPRLMDADAPIKAKAELAGKASAKPLIAQADRLRARLADIEGVLMQVT